MTSESAILRAYAMLSQGRCDEAERMLKSVPEALATPSGADLLARLRFEQGFADEAREIWNRVHAAFPDFESAAKALDAFANPPSDEADDGGACGLSKRVRVAAVVVLVAVAVGMVVPVVSSFKGCRRQTNEEALPPVAVAGAVNCVTSYVDRVRTEFVDRIVTNVVERMVEVPSRLTLTNVIDRIVCLTNLVTVVVTNRIDAPPSVETSTDIARPVETTPPARVQTSGVIVLSTPYVVREGDTISGLAARYGFRMPDFVVYNPGMDVNRINVGQVVHLPGNVKTEELP